MEKQKYGIVLNVDMKPNVSRKKTCLILLDKAHFYCVGKDYIAKEKEYETVSG